MIAFPVTQISSFHFYNDPRGFLLHKFICLKNQNFKLMDSAQSNRLAIEFLIT